MRELPMFPLGVVLLPHMLLPLHVFEPRYRDLVRDVLAGDGRFGVVLIERGHEVGGGDTRTSLGTVAQVLETEELDDGRWVLVALGTRRIRVARWLPDDPYPRAEVEELDEPSAGPDDQELRDHVAARLRRYLALSSELGDVAPPATTEVDPDPLVAGYQMTGLAQLGPADTQRLLAAASPGDRLRRLDQALQEAMQLLDFRLGTAPGRPDPHDRDDRNDRGGTDGTG